MTNLIFQSVGAAIGFALYGVWIFFLFEIGKHTLMFLGVI